MQVQETKEEDGHVDVDENILVIPGRGIDQLYKVVNISLAEIILLHSLFQGFSFNLLDLEFLSLGDIKIQIPTLQENEDTTSYFSTNIGLVARAEICL